MKLLSEGLENGLVKETNQIVKLTVDGIEDLYSVYKIKLNCLYYNDQNDRIATWMSQYKQENNLDNIPRSDVNFYNNLIHSFITESNPEQQDITEKDIKEHGQQVYGVVLNDGRIIDGNRRFTCLRNLSKKNSKFNYFEAVILKENYEKSSKAIKTLELQLQMGKQKPVDYGPIDRLVGLYKSVEESKELTLEEYAEAVSGDKNKLKTDLEVAKLMMEFLDQINAPKQYYIARDLKLDGPLRELLPALKKVKDKNKNRDLKFIGFSNIVAAPFKDMTHGFMRDFKKIVNSRYDDFFIEKESPITYKVLDHLKEKEKISSADINALRGDLKVKDELQRALKITIQTMGEGNKKDKNIKYLQEARDTLNKIELQVVKRFDPMHKEGFFAVVDDIENLLNKIKAIR